MGGVAVGCYADGQGCGHEGSGRHRITGRCKLLLRDEYSKLFHPGHVCLFASNASFLPKYLSLVVNTLKQLVEGIFELLHSLLLQSPGDLLVGDPDVLEGHEIRLRPWELVLDGEPNLAVIVETLNRGEGHSVHGVGTDQFLDVQHIAVGWIFRACTGP